MEQLRSDGGEEGELERLRKGKYIPARRLVHLDMKGAPPLMSYLIALLPIMKGAGATDLLVEWEDMFPYWGPIANISAKNSYTKSEVSLLLQAAKENNIGVIPLIQTFGHLEFVLKLAEFSHLREEAPYPQAACPSLEEGDNMIQLMLHQVAEIHTEATHIHIGCDEVFQLGSCSRCVERLARANEESQGNAYYDNRFLFLSHVKKVGEMVAKLGKVALVWDDMLRTVPLSDIKDSEIGSVVEPMVWVYIEDIDRFVDSLAWRMYAQVFSGVWTASAFKGAFGEKEYVPDIQRHLQNQLSWLEVMQRETTNQDFPVNFRGIALTGWSRYDHFASLCELLPVAVPSLVASLLVLSLGSLQLPVSRRIHNALKCTNQKVLITAEELRRNPQQWEMYRCNFPGSRAFGAISTYNMHRAEVEQIYHRVREESSWMTEWHLRRNFSSPWRVQEIMRGAGYLPGAIRELGQQTRRGLSPFIEATGVSEWIEQHIHPLSNRLSEVMSIADQLSKVTAWPRRPV